MRGSESLCKLLQYLAKHAIEHPGTPLKEYQIALEVYGRRPDFNPNSDSTIRVQAGRLRQKLTEYYASEGVDDPIHVELPKGMYLLTFHHREAKGTKAPEAVLTVPVPRQTVAEQRASRFLRMALIAVTALLLVAAWIIRGLLQDRRAQPSRALAAESEQAPESLRTLWRPFTSGPEEPWLIFSNAAFVGRPETGMRYFRSGEDPGKEIWDHYTGVGEVLGMHELDQVFAQLHHRFRAKRGSLFTLDDAKNNDLIFLGSPSENLTLLDIPGTQEFVFDRVNAGPRKGDLAIVNRHPQVGEASRYLASPSGVPLTEDYSIIGFLPGLNPSRSVMILAGTTTFGTQAAVEFVSRPSSAGTLLTKLTRNENGDLKPFEAVVHVKIARGVPVETELVAVRQR